MNFLSHALPYRNRPIVAVATGTPDWLSLIDRKIRARRRNLLPHLDSSNRMVRDVAAGIMAHLDDDQWFHTTEAFVELNLFLAMQLREILPDDEGFRPMFVGHILIEVLLDAFWITDDRSYAERYYESIESLDTVEYERAVNLITGKPTDQLVNVMNRYAEAKFLYDYLDPTKLLLRLNQVMSRVGLAQLPDSMVPWIERVESQVRSRRKRLLTPPGHVSIDFPPIVELT